MHVIMITENVPSHNKSLSTLVDMAPRVRELEFMDLNLVRDPDFFLSHACDKLNTRGEYKNVKNIESSNSNHVCGL